MAPRSGATTQSPAACTSTQRRSSSSEVSHWLSARCLKAVSETAESTFHTCLTGARRPGGHGSASRGSASVGWKSCAGGCRNSAFVSAGRSSTGRKRIAWRMAPLGEGVRGCGGSVVPPGWGLRRLQVEYYVSGESRGCGWEKEMR